MARYVKCVYRRVVQYAGRVDCLFGQVFHQLRQTEKQHGRIVRFGPNVGQIGTKWDKSGTF